MAGDPSHEGPPAAAPLHPPLAGAARRPDARFLLAHPAHLLALGFGSGLAPKAPGTVGTLWAWLAFALLDRLLAPAGWAVLLAAGLGLGWWACTLTARHLAVADPGCIVWDEVIAFWLVLWLLGPASWPAQALAFGLFRVLDAAKPGPVAWADGLFKPRRGAPEAIGWRQGLGILLDDLVAGLLTLLPFAVWKAWPR